jgi:hypothetical protein
MIDYSGGHWTLGAIFGIPMLILCAILCVGTWAALYAVRDDGEAIGYVFVVGWVPWLGLILGTLSYYPFDSSFHHYYPVSGTVVTSNSRLISDSDHNVSQRYVIQFAESGVLYGCDDTRCSLATVGKHINLQCKKEFVWQSKAGWTCRYDQED